MPEQEPTTDRLDGTMSNEVFEALSDGYRRGLLVALLEHDALDLDDLSLPDCVTSDAGGSDPSRVRVTNVHLPTLEREDFIEWNRDTNVARRGERFEGIRPLLEWLYGRDDEPVEGLQVRRTGSELREWNERVKDHITAVSHDLRGLFNVADGYVRLALDTGELSHLDTTRQTIARAEELVDQFETLATHGELQFEPEPVDLRDVSETAWGVVTNRDAELIVAETRTLMADRGQLQQLLENLFKNAVEHAGPDVTVSVDTLENGGFSVEDDGPGIPQAERSSVFQMGVSGDPGHTGVGLTICKQIADVHEWSIAITDAPEGGARFEVGAGRT